jgi:tetratricopeptide (TPR) repeat protein
MASVQIKLCLAVRHVDTELADATDRYPRELPPTHIALLRGWSTPLQYRGGLLTSCTAEEFGRLGPLARTLEVNRCQAEAELARARAGEVRLTDEAKELLRQRALGILPTDEAARFLEIASCPELAPQHIAASPERMVSGIAEVERECGLATALGYGGLLMAGVRTTEDLVKYGDRIEQLFNIVTNKEPAASLLLSLDGDITSLPHAGRSKLTKSVRDSLWQLSPSRVGRPFLLTQVIDGYLGLRNGGVGDDLGLALVDAIVIAKLALPVHFLLIKGGVYLEIGVSAHGFEYWDPLSRTSAVRVTSARRLSTVDVLAQGYTRMARGYANLRSFQHGIRVAQWVLGMQPRCAEALEILGQCRLGEERPREAIEACNQALELDHRLADAHLVQGNAYGMLGRWDRAVECYKEAIESRVGFAEAYNNLALALAHCGEFERAEGAYREAVRVRPDYAEAYYNLGNLHFERALSLAESQQKPLFDRAIDAYHKAVEQAPDFAGAYYNLGQACYGKHDLHAALTAYQSAVKANPKHAGAWHNMGIVYRDMGRQDLAVDALEKAVTLNPMLLR